VPFEEAWEIIVGRGESLQYNKMERMLELPGGTYVSRKHATISRDTSGRTLYVTDMSTSGTNLYRRGAVLIEICDKLMELRARDQQQVHEQWYVKSSLTKETLHVTDLLAFGTKYCCSVEYLFAVKPPGDSAPSRDSAPKPRLVTLAQKPPSSPTASQARPSRDSARSRDTRPSRDSARSAPEPRLVTLAQFQQHLADLGWKNVTSEDMLERLRSLDAERTLRDVAYGWASPPSAETVQRLEAVMENYTSRAESSGRQSWSAQLACDTDLASAPAAEDRSAPAAEDRKARSNRFRSLWSR